MTFNIPTFPAQLLNRQRAAPSAQPLRCHKRLKADRHMKWNKTKRTQTSGTWWLKAFFKHFIQRYMVHGCSRHLGCCYSCCCSFTGCLHLVTCPAAVCISKQVPFFAYTTCRRRTQNASECTDIVHLWQRLEGQGFRFGAWKSKRDAGWVIRIDYRTRSRKVNASLQHFQWTELWLKREARAARPSHRPAARSISDSFPAHGGN